MDTAVSNGDFLCDANNCPIELSGYNEILQRVLVNLNVKKGTFVYDKDLGSRLYTLKANTGNVQTKALSLVKEALINLKEVTVEDIYTKLTNNNENLELNIILSINETTKEVTINL